MAAVTDAHGSRLQYRSRRKTGRVRKSCPSEDLLGQLLLLARAGKVVLLAVVIVNVSGG